MSMSEIETFNCLLTNWFRTGCFYIFAAASKLSPWIPSLFVKGKPKKTQKTDFLDYY